MRPSPGGCFSTHPRSRLAPPAQRLRQAPCVRGGLCSTRSAQPVRSTRPRSRPTSRTYVLALRKQHGPRNPHPVKGPSPFLKKKKTEHTHTKPHKKTKDWRNAESTWIFKALTETSTFLRLIKCLSNCWQVMEDRTQKHTSYEV